MLLLFGLLEGKKCIGATGCFCGGFNSVTDHFLRYERKGFFSDNLCPKVASTIGKIQSRLYSTVFRINGV